MKAASILQLQDTKTLSLQEKLSTMRGLDSEVLDLIEDEHLENEI